MLANAKVLFAAHATPPHASATKLGAQSSTLPRQIRVRQRRHCGKTTKQILQRCWAILTQSLHMRLRTCKSDVGICNSTKE
jgi:hypothetical protein